MIAAAALLAGLLAASSGVPSAVQFDCALALMTPQRQLTATTPVTISFAADGDRLSDIHVVDAGGILYPGGNMKVVAAPDVKKVEAVSIPAERPGTWSGKIEKKMYRLTLRSDATQEAAVIGLARAADAKAGRYGLVWNATNQPPGVPQPISGSGIGSCMIIGKKDGQ